MFHFAWVADTETTFGPAHEREDEQVVAIAIGHREGDFATLAIRVKNPRVGLLASGRKQWAWLSWTDDEAPTDGAVPLFFGRLVGLPEQVQGNAVTLNFVARPQDYDAIKAALAETLKVAPYWDPIFVKEDRRDDPDAVMEARIEAWHIDRVTHAVTVSNMLAGEDGTIELSDDYLRESLSIELGAPPLRRVTVEAELSWDQAAVGTVDLSERLVAAFKAAGTSKKFTITSFTGEGLMRDWPTEGDRIGGGWEIGTSEVVRTDGKVFPQDYQQVVMTNGLVNFPVWSLKPTLVARFDVSRQRVEKVSFTLSADCQALLTEPGDEEILTISVASDDVGNPVDPADTDHPDGNIPIGDVRRRAYLPTERGKRSLEYLIALARGALLERARAVEITVSIPFRAGLGLSCRKNARIADPRLPGGEATGKIVGYGLSAEGGREIATVTIGCVVGRGNTVSPAPGTPTYVEDDYVEDGWQVMTGATVMPIAGEVTYTDFGHIPPNDDGVDFLNIRADDIVTQMTVFNGEAAQRAVLREFKFDVAHAVEALNEVYTEVDFDLKVLKGGPFVTEYQITVSDLMVPRTIDLESA